MRTTPMDEIKKITGKTDDEIMAVAKTAREQLYTARQSRSKPTDTKLLAGWNGLALQAFANGAIRLDEPRYAKAAKAIRDYIVNTLWVDGKLLRAVSSRGSLGQTSVQDYAYVARGLYAYAEHTGAREDYELAATITALGFELFNRENGWYLAERSLIMPEQVQPALEDGALPSPSAVLADTAWQLAAKLEDQKRGDDLYQLAQRALSPAGRYLDNNLFGFATYARVMHNFRAARADTKTQ